MGYPRGGSTEVTWLAGNDWSNGKVINITPYVTDIHWEGDDLVAEARVDDDQFLVDVTTNTMSFEFSLSQISDEMVWLYGWRSKPYLAKMHTDYRRKTRRRNRRR